MNDTIRKLSLIVLFIINTVTYSQVTEAEVFYKQTVIKKVFDSITVKEKDLTNNGYLSIVNNSLQKYGDAFEYKLNIMQHEALFKQIESLAIDDQLSYTIAFNLAEADNLYYTNNSTKEKMVQKPAFGKIYRVISVTDNSAWEFHKETKKIGKYTCYKASTIKMIKNTSGVFKILITAWYAPEIPLSFGPKGYGNLPGLIVELEDNFFKYTISKLILNSNSINSIEKPSKGEIITETEFEKMAEETSKRMRKF